MYLQLAAVGFRERPRPVSRKRPIADTSSEFAGIEDPPAAAAQLAGTAGAFAAALVQGVRLSIEYARVQACTALSLLELTPALDPIVATFTWSVPPPARQLGAWA
jgi:hypothetical protein